MAKKATKKASKKTAKTTKQSAKKSKIKAGAREPWTAADLKEMKTLVKQNTPTRLIGLKLGRTAISVRGKAQREGISLAPTNRSPRD